MKNVNDMPDKLSVLKEEQIKRIMAFYDNHKSHIDKLVSNTELAYEPSQVEDKNDPMIWKPEHWKWFLSK
jgi:sucrose-6-phosphate hydrolase SacC (GH32 family)